VGEHIGGYDEWTVDITDAAAMALKNAAFKGEVPLAVLCDNSRDAESIPSDLSDFNRYGGLYRHVTLVYAPAISVERIHIEPTLGADGKASAKVRTRLYNPSGLQDDLEFNLEVFDPQGRWVHHAAQAVPALGGSERIAAFEIPRPQLWSPKSPSLYRCVLSVKSRHGEQTLRERFGLRSFEWVEHGPFKLNGNDFSCAARTITKITRA